MIKAGHTLFSATPIDDDSIQACREFVMMHELTRDDVKIIKLVNSVMVVARRDLDGR